MKIVLVPSTVSGVVGDPLQFATSYVINDTIAIDAGTLGFYKTPDDQARIQHVLISHSHADHVASLPIFIENVFGPTPDCPTLYGNQNTLDCLQQDIFNNRVWPDFITMSEGPMQSTPFLKLKHIEAGQTLEFGELKITTVAADHVVPTLGFFLQQGDSTVLIPSDTGPTEEVWRQANEISNLKAVFLEVCFPDSMIGLANAAKHLVPSTFKAEALKLRHRVPVYAVHIKGRFREKVVQELDALEIPGYEPARFGVPYVF
ncbi:3',5'-cyclic-nucleotide phosphodiesterase [soil metagenome]